MGKLVDPNVTILYPNLMSVEFATNYIVECYPNEPDEEHEHLRKFRVDERRTMIRIIFQELDEMVWNGQLSSGVRANLGWDPTEEESDVE